MLRTENRPDTIIFWSIILIIFAAAWLLQNTLYLNCDVAWLINSTRLALAGKTYTNDFYSPNPPIVLLLYLPPVLFSHWLGVKVMIPFRAYIFLLTLVSLGICTTLSRRIFPNNARHHSTLFIVILTILFLLFPIAEFGQRDNLLLPLIFPYLLLATLRLRNEKISGFPAAAIGLMAGMGLGMKPMFLWIWILVEGYTCIRQKTWHAVWRTENQAMLGFFVCYMLFTVALFPDYITDIIPYVYQNYYQNIGRTVDKLIIFPPFAYCVFACVYFLWQFRQIAYSDLFCVLTLALSGLLFAYFGQHVLFYHHIMPAVAVATLLQIMFFVIIAEKPVLVLQDYVRLAVLSSLPLYFLRYYVNPIHAMLIFHPLVFYAFFSMFFLAVIKLTRSHFKLAKILAITFVIISLSYCGIYLTQLFSSNYRFALSLLIMTVFFIVLTVTSAKDFYQQIFIGMAGLAVVFFPVSYTLFLYQGELAYKTNILDKLMTFMQTQPSHLSLYALTYQGDLASPLFEYAGDSLVQRYDCLWMVVDLAKKARRDGWASLTESIKNNNDPAYFINRLTDDLIRHKPELVFIDTQDTNILLNNHRAYFDFLRAFLAAPRFKEEWRNYTYLTTLSGGDAFSSKFQVQVYKRKGFNHDS
jgi:hypothetical protein